MNETFLWHDYETFGADTRRDRPAQFAAVRTDTDLEAVGEPLVLYCRPADDVLPHPDACVITGITPQQARARGVPENEFAAAIAEVMQRPGTCSVGFNNFRFDDEVTRHLFWRNFFDPYAREYANGNSRFDLIDLARMTRALRPEGLNWPDREDGTPSFRLEDLAAANGLDTRRAHDALADVEATLGLARKIRNAQPRLWQWALQLRQRHVVSKLLEPKQPLLHSSARLPARRYATAAVLPLACHPSIRSQWLIWNLREDPAPYLHLTEEQLADLLWTPAADLPDGQERLPVKLVRTNRCPMLAPITVLNEAAAKRLAIDPRQITDHAHRLAAAPAFIERLQGLFNQPSAPAADPELALYAGFVPKADLVLRDRVRTMAPEALFALNEPFQDERLNELLFRYRARLWPDRLDDEERIRWKHYCRRRLIDDPELAGLRIDDYRQRVQALLQDSPAQREVLEALMHWPEEIGLNELQNQVSGT
ncbi:exodeoxyribonuclease I [Wenzhouxiangella limi]|uniref:Exodeoxyribonuclease I n=1 Tax=Wenzhouxiangella limi TaxID=2707351 RepID=A0A845VHT2_9GAMM|nr:exodeoxyribonuclease I [Wenzhouxiangella limi]NDY96749.1 exodeoxyribonuclease I [Wenzhouxiangella limi]